MQEVTGSEKETEDFGQEKKLYKDSFQIIKNILVLKKTEDGVWHCI